MNKYKLVLESVNTEKPRQRLKLKLTIHFTKNKVGII